MPKTNLNELRDFVGTINSQNGFSDREINIAELAALITTECSEMVEASRIGKHSDIEAFEDRMSQIKNSLNSNLSEEEKEKRLVSAFKQQFKNHIKEGVEAELVDCMIRCFHTAYRLNIDLDKLFDLITHHNSIRGYKHGKLY